MVADFMGDRARLFALSCSLTAAHAILMRAWLLFVYGALPHFISSKIYVIFQILIIKHGAPNSHVLSIHHPYSREGLYLVISLSRC